ncbi:MAG: hypothetical protein V3U75_04035 [Methylococcaceae bacterium]
MNITDKTDIIDKICSKKTGIAVAGLAALAYVTSPPEYIAIVICVAIVVQGAIDVFKIWKGKKDDSVQ